MNTTAPLLHRTALAWLLGLLVLGGGSRLAARCFPELQMPSVDWLGRRLFISRQGRSVRVERAKLERTDEPDRRYDGDLRVPIGPDLDALAGCGALDQRRERFFRFRD